MKLILVSLMLLGSSALARTINHVTNITRGPYYVGATSAAFNPLASDFKSEGEVLVYMDGLNLSIEFPRVDLVTTKAVADKDDYFYTPGNKGLKARVGFTGDKLSWFFARNSGWTVTIADELKETGREATAFAKMDDEQIELWASRSFGETEEGGLENIKISRKAGGIVVTADVMVMEEEQSDDPVKVGTATLTFNDTDGARSITVKAEVKK